MQIVGGVLTCARQQFDRTHFTDGVASLLRSKSFRSFSLGVVLARPQLRSRLPFLYVCVCFILMTVCQFAASLVTRRGTTISIGVSNVCVTHSVTSGLCAVWRYSSICRLNYALRRHSLPTVTFCIVCFDYETEAARRHCVHSDLVYLKQLVQQKTISKLMARFISRAAERNALAIVLASARRGNDDDHDCCAT